MTVTTNHRLMHNQRDNEPFTVMSCPEPFAKQTVSVSPANEGDFASDFLRSGRPEPT
jgi:hypothetical protein